jgi:hypothetical protein
MSYGYWKDNQNYCMRIIGWYFHTIFHIKFINFGRLLVWILTLE